MEERRYTHPVPEQKNSDTHKKAVHGGRSGQKPPETQRPEGDRKPEEPSRCVLVREGVSKQTLTARLGSSRPFRSEKQVVC